MAKDSLWQVLHHNEWQEVLKSLGFTKWEQFAHASEASSFMAFKAGKWYYGHVANDFPGSIWIDLRKSFEGTGHQAILKFQIDLKQGELTTKREQVKQLEEQVDILNQLLAKSL
jgi:hypothetical protein